MSDETTKYKTYHFLVNKDHPLPYRIDEGFTIPHGEYVMLSTEDLTDLTYDLRFKPVWSGDETMDSALTLVLTELLKHLPGRTIIEWSFDHDINLASRAFMPFGVDEPDTETFKFEVTVRKEDDNG